MALRPGIDREADALHRLLKALQGLEYHFITPTPATHARVLRHPGKDRARTLRDVFGWSRPFDRTLLPGDLLALMEEGDVLREGEDGWRSTVRVSSLDRLLLLHSAYPTSEDDAVFFGPDSYRFADFARRELRRLSPVRRLLDIGAGAGAGALAAGLDLPEADLVLTDVNPKALRLARINAEAAGRPVLAIETDTLDVVPGLIDVAIANPPYIIDRRGRQYRDGGDLHGGRVSVEMAAAALARLPPGGTLLLYTGTAIVDGRDEVEAALRALAADRGASLRYGELDPDVFGEELAKRDYFDVERIAVVGAVITAPG